jgi:glycogen synthase
VQIEAMACGTPVIAWRRGSVPEVIEDGVSGFIVDSVDEAVEAVDRVRRLSRRTVRRSFERRFSIERVASDYARIYDSISAERFALPQVAHFGASLAARRSAARAALRERASWDARNAKGNP